MLKDLVSKTKKLDQYAVLQAEITIKGKVHKISINDIREEKDEDSGLKFAIMSNKKNSEEEE